MPYKLSASPPLPPETRPGYPSLCIPYVPDSTTKVDVAIVFGPLCGEVDRVDMVPKVDHFLVFVHFKQWRPAAAELRHRLITALQRNSRDKEWVETNPATKRGWRFSASRAAP